MPTRILLIATTIEASCSSLITFKALNKDIITNKNINKATIKSLFLGASLKF